MATPRTLSRPPISEALVDFRASVPQPQEAFERLAKGLHARFPAYEVKRAMRAEVKIDHGKLIPPTAEDLGFQGITLKGSDGIAVVQFGPEGFTFNNLKMYLGGDRLISEARVSEFLGRVVAHQGEATVIVTQRMKAPSAGLPAVIIDVDAFRVGEFGVDLESLRPVLEELRILKNRTFFSLLTDEAVALYTL